MRVVRAVCGVSMLVALAALRPETAAAQRPAQATAVVRVTILPPVPQPTMDAELDARSWRLAAANGPGLVPPASSFELPARDSVTGRSGRIRVLAWVGT